MNEYRYEATGIPGFVQQLAVSYLTNGYHQYVACRIPPHKDPVAVDCKLIRRYDIAVSKWTRARRKKAGLANLQYLRLGRYFLLLATSGRHRFFEDEAASIRDVSRGQPIQFASYSIGYYNGRVSVRLPLMLSQQVRGELLRLALRLDTASLDRRFASLPFEPYAPVRRQLYSILRAVNAKRKTAGLEMVDWRCIRSRRRVVEALLPPQLESGKVSSEAA